VWKPRIVQRGESATSLSGAVLFGILWDELVDLVGSAGTAVLMRRALRRALLYSAELQELTIGRVDEEFRYVLPPSFNLTMGPSPALHHLADELRPLLAELTGEVALRHLGRVPELQVWMAAAPLAS
jgi:hypothetical protein